MTTMSCGSTRIRSACVTGDLRNFSTAWRSSPPAIGVGATEYRPRPTLWESADEYFLSSIMLLNRPVHEPMLRLAREILPHTSGRVFEQTALNAARYRLGLPMKWLDRRFNWSLFGEGNLHESGAPIVAHFNSDSLRREPPNLSIGSDSNEVQSSAFEQLGDKFYRYSRIGHDERPLLLRADGTIGLGGRRRGTILVCATNQRGVASGGRVRNPSDMRTSPRNRWRLAWPLGRV